MSMDVGTLSHVKIAGLAVCCVFFGSIAVSIHFRPSGPTEY